MKSTSKIIQTQHFDLHIIFLNKSRAPLTKQKVTFFDYRLDKFEGLKRSFLELGKTIFLSYVQRDEKNEDSDQENCVYVQRLILQSSSSANIVAGLWSFLLVSHNLSTGNRFIGGQLGRWSGFTLIHVIVFSEHIPCSLFSFILVQEL